MAARTDHTVRANAIAGQTFGDLLVTGESERRSKGGNVYYICRCSCAEVFEVRSDALNNGHTKRCRRCGFQTEGHAASPAPHQSYAARTTTRKNARRSTSSSSRRAPVAATIPKVPARLAPVGSHPNSTLEQRM